MAAPSITNTFTSNTTALASEMNANFADILAGLSSGSTWDVVVSTLTSGTTTLGSTSATSLKPATAASFPFYLNNGTTEIGSYSTAGVWTLGPSAGITGSADIGLKVGGNTLTNWTAGPRVAIGGDGTANNSKIVFGASTGTNEPFITSYKEGVGASGLRFGSYLTDIGGYSAAGAWTLGPAAGGVSHKINGNVGIGTGSEATVRLLTEGSDSTSSNFAFAARNSTPTNAFLVRNDLAVLTNSGTIDGATSDIRLKENIRPITDALCTICAMKPTFFDWKKPASHAYPTQAGFIAQEIAAIKSDWVQKGCASKEELEADLVTEDDVLTTRLSDLQAYLVKAIQELKAELDEAKTKIAALEAK